MASGAPPDRGRTLDHEAAARFLRLQGSRLREGLECARDPHAVAEVLAVHDASHHAWIGLIAAVQEALGDEAARTMSTLYALHGRVAGSLERGPDPRLSGAVCAEVRALLGTSLQKLTDAAIAAATPSARAAASTPAEGLV